MRSQYRNHENLAAIQEDRELHEVPIDWRAWESYRLSLARRQVEEHERLYHRELFYLSVFTILTLVVLFVATQTTL